jgi:hypothetical protein
MKSSKGLAKRRKDVRARTRFSNYIVFPQELRDAIPGPELPGCARSLILSSIDGAWSSDHFFGKRVRLKFLAKESGKLKGSFEIGIDLEPDAARAMAATLLDLAERVEKLPPE